MQQSVDSRVDKIISLQTMEEQSMAVLIQQSISVSHNICFVFRLVYFGDFITSKCEQQFCDADTNVNTLIMEQINIFKVIFIKTKKLLSNAAR